MSKVLVLGGTGMLGTPVVRHLVDEGVDVRLLARNPIKAREIFGHTVEIVAGVVRDLGALERAMDGCTAVHLSVGGPAERESVANVTSLAPTLGVRRVTYVSGTTVCDENAWYPMVAVKLEAERAIRDRVKSWTIFRPTWAMEQLHNFLRTGRPIVIGELSTPYHFFAADDFGRMVSHAHRWGTADGRCLYVHGPEAIAVKEAVERYAHSIDPEYGHASAMSVRKARAIAFVTRNRRLRFAADLMGYFEKVGEPGDPTEANELLGPPTTTLDDWIHIQTAVPV